MGPDHHLDPCCGPSKARPALVAPAGDDAIRPQLTPKTLCFYSQRGVIGAVASVGRVLPIASASGRTEVGHFATSRAACGPLAHKGRRALYKEAKRVQMQLQKETQSHTLRSSTGFVAGASGLGGWVPFWSPRRRRLATSP